MRKIFTLIILLVIISSKSFSQSVVLLQNDFTGYAGITSTIAPGWYYSYNDSGTTKSYYTSLGNYGANPPSYKFGRDSVTIITPRIIGSPDTVSFWMKGNGSSTSFFSVQNTFYIYESTDSINWTLNTQIDSMTVLSTGSTDSLSVKFPLSATTAFLKFYYHKFVGNIAFDNLVITGLANGISSVSLNDKEPIVYPNPTKGLVTIELNNLHSKNTSVTFYNVLGKEVKKILLRNSESVCQSDLSEFQDGVYFVQIKSDTRQTTQRIVLRK